MIVPQGFYVINQPKQRIPSVLDLNEYGMFKTRPFVTSSWTYRIIADEKFQVKLQYICLLEKMTTDPKTGRRYDFVVEDRLIDLDEHLRVKPTDLKASVEDKAAREKILAGIEEFRNAYIPLDENKKPDKEALQKKMSASIAESRDILRKKLALKNNAWISAALPRLIQDFRRYYFIKVGDCLQRHYQQLGGKDGEQELIKKISLFNRIYESDSGDLMRKPDGETWENEDEIWECWVGFAGGEKEAKRVCRAMNAVLRPLADELADRIA